MYLSNNIIELSQLPIRISVVRLKRVLQIIDEILEPVLGFSSCPDFFHGMHQILSQLFHLPQCELQLACGHHMPK